MNRVLYHRRSIRLKKYDYSYPGSYFITICTHDHNNIFGEIIRGKVILNDHGIIAEKNWIDIPNHYDNVILDKFVVMPDHMHGIIILLDNSNCRGTACRAPTAHRPHALITIHENFGKPTSNSIPTIVRSYKSSVTKDINDLRNAAGRVVWQRNYYEHIIRTQSDLLKIQQYIINNPRNSHK